MRITTPARAVAGPVSENEHAGLPRVVATNLRKHVVSDEGCTLGNFGFIFGRGREGGGDKARLQTTKNSGGSSSNTSSLHVTFSASASGGQTSQPSGRCTSAPLHHSHAPISSQSRDHVSRALCVVAYNVAYTGCACRAIVNTNSTQINHKHNQYSSLVRANAAAAHLLLRSI